MRYGLLALSIAMLGSGGVAAQSALDISYSVAVTIAENQPATAERGASYGSVPLTGARALDLHLAAR